MSSMKTFYPSYFVSHQMTQDLGYQEIRKSQKTIKFEQGHSVVPSAQSLDIKVFTSCPIFLNFLLFHVYFVEVCLKKQIFVQNLFHSPPSLNQPKPFVEKFEISQFSITSNSQNHPVHKRTLNHLAKLASFAKRLSVCFELSDSGFESSCSHLKQSYIPKFESLLKTSRIKEHFQTIFFIMFQNFTKFQQRFNMPEVSQQENQEILGKSKIKPSVQSILHT